MSTDLKGNELPSIIQGDVIHIEHWITHIIEGVGGMRDYEHYEMSPSSDATVRAKAADWVLRCLANPKCEHSEDVLQAILDERERKKALACAGRGEAKA